LGNGDGFDPVWMPDFLFDFQRHLVDWAVRRGRAAIFASPGMGKTPMQLTWAENVIRHTNRPVLILAPIAVGAQTVREGEKFGVECVRSADGSFPVGARVVVANYERLHYFDPGDFAGVVCDESSCIKDFRSKTKDAVTEFMRTIPYRLLCTATAAPNDFVELGTSAEALGELGFKDMLTRFFKQRDRSYSHRGWKLQADKYQLRGHAEKDFWRWICSWARACRMPSDLGFDDGPFILPPLVEREHKIDARTNRPGYLFDLPAEGLHEEREEARRTIVERSEKVAELIATHPGHSIAWCHLNDEGDTLERLIPGSVQVSGADSEEAKEEAIDWFIGPGTEKRVLISKPEIFGFGLNLQCCHHMTFYPSHSFERWYQAVHRCLRFGQQHPVTVDTVTTEGTQKVVANLRRKADQADAMFARLVEHMNDSLRVGRSRYGDLDEELPPWLSSASTSPIGSRPTGAIA
jgi:hypothetical protein